MHRRYTVLYEVCFFWVFIFSMFYHYICSHHIIENSNRWQFVYAFPAAPTKRRNFCAKTFNSIFHNEFRLQRERKLNILATLNIIHELQASNTLHVYSIFFSVIKYSIRIYGFWVRKALSIIWKREKKGQFNKEDTENLNMIQWTVDLCQL